MVTSTNKELPVLLSYRRACGELDISRTTLYELLRAGKLKSVLVGSKGRRIPSAEIDRFVSENLS